VLAGGLGGLGGPSGYVVRVRPDAAGGAEEQERVFMEVGQRVRDVRVGPDGAIYLLTDHPEDGRLVRVTPRAAGPA
jgi:glucose/arabinose dehydrogenase